MRKKLLLLLFVLSLFVVPMALGATGDDAKAFFKGILDFVTSEPKMATALVVWFVATIAFWFGSIKATAALGWDEGKTRNGRLVLSLILGLSAAWAVWVSDYTIKSFSENFGAKIIAVFIFCVVIGLLVMLAWKQGGPSRAMPFLIPLVYVALYFIIDFIVPDWTDKLGLFGWFITAGLWLCAGFLIWELFSFVTTYSLRRKPKVALTAQQEADRQRDIQGKFTEKALKTRNKMDLRSQKAAAKPGVLAAEETADTAKRAKNLRNNLRNAIGGSIWRRGGRRGLLPRLKTIAGVLSEYGTLASGELWSAMVDKKNIKKLREVDLLQSEIGGYLGIVDNLVGELRNINPLPVNPAVINQMETLSKNVLVLFKRLNSTITPTLGKIYKNVAPADSAEWQILENKFNAALIIVQEIQKDLNGLLALEQKIPVN